MWKTFDQMPNEGETVVLMSVYNQLFYGRYMAKNQFKIILTNKLNDDGTFTQLVGNMSRDYFTHWINIPLVGEG